jgi:endonuclease YncB( thermonuclease family)
MFRFCFACIYLCTFITTCHAEEGVYKVTYVYDGDTVKLRPIDSDDPNDEFKFRLTDIDAPERNQDFGLKSRRALMKLCQGKNIIATAQISGIDKYQRSLGRLKCNQVDANYYLAEHGFAWYYAQYSNDIAIYKAAKNARRLTLGLWADESPIAPWNWRHEHLYY